MKEIKNYASYCDEATKEQIDKIGKDPCLVDADIAIMPDAHKGVEGGACIGFSAVLKKGIVNPNLVSNDIGCGITIVSLGDWKPDNRKGNKHWRRMTSFEKIDEVIRGDQIDRQERFSLGVFVVPWMVRHLDTLKEFMTNEQIEHVQRTFGTLGNGNHFIELLKDNDGKYYLAVHSGSRAFGTIINNYYIHKYAEDRNKRVYEEKQRILKEVPDEDKENALKTLKSSYTSTPEINIEEYLKYEQLGVEWAYESRKAMIHMICDHLGIRGEELYVNITHNFLDKFESMSITKDGVKQDETKYIVRKGSVPSYKGVPLAIALNMTAGLVVATGKGNKEWNWTAPHGAGRKFSRTKAKQTYNMELFKQDMKDANVYSTCVSERTLDEIPQAYKDPEIVLKDTEPTMEIVNVLKPVYNFKCEN